MGQQTKTFSIRVIITALFSVLFSIALVSIVSVLFLRTEGAIQTLSKRLNQSIANQVQQQFSIVMSPVEQFFWANKFLIKKGELSTQKEELIKKMLLELVNSHGHIFNAYIAFEDGTFVMASKEKELKYTYINPKKNQTIYVDYSRDYEKKDMKVVRKIDFNPKVREWYKGALKTNKIYSSGIYTFHQSQKLGVTISKPFYDKQQRRVGVMGIDILSSRLKAILSAIKTSESSVLGLVDFSKKPRLVSSSIDKNNRLKLSIIKTFFKFSKDQEYKRVDVEGEPFYLTSTLVSPSFFPEWFVFIAMPEKELLKEIIMVQQQSFFLGLGVLVLGIFFIFMFSKMLSAPIRIISSQALKIKKLEEVEQLDIKTPVKEVGELIQSINSMGVAFDAFSHYVPKSIVKHLIETNQKADISGKNFHVTLLFTDIKNFTGFSESEEPEMVSKFLSEYFEIISNLILEYGGTIDKYIGDSVMAFWGAPKIVSNQYENAARCILEVRKKMKSPEFMNHPVLSKFDTRFALHSGNVVVGNIGSRDRFNYTAIGREVNLCSRLESVNKQFNTHVLVSNSFQKMIGNTMPTRPLDSVKLKGFTAPVFVHELLEDDIKPEQLTAYLQCHDLYMNKKFAEAKESFEDLKKRYPNDEVLDYFITQCNTYLS